MKRRNAIWFAIAALLVACTASLPPADVQLIKDTQGALASMLDRVDGGQAQVPTALIKVAYCNTTIVLKDLKTNDSDAGITCPDGGAP